MRETRLDGEVEGEFLRFYRYFTCQQPCITGIFRYPLTISFPTPEVTEQIHPH